MNTFSSTLELENLQGFDIGIPTKSPNTDYLLLKLFLLALILSGVFYYIYSLVQKKEQDISEKTKLQ